MSVPPVFILATHRNTSEGAVQFLAKISSTRILKKRTLCSTTGRKHYLLKPFMQIGKLFEVQKVGHKGKTGMWHGKFAKIPTF